MGLSMLKPAAPSVDRATPWVDIVKKGELLREVCAAGPPGRAVAHASAQWTVQPSHAAAPAAAWPGIQPRADQDAARRGQPYAQGTRRSRLQEPVLRI